ncbi:MAG: alanine racemase [Rickettsiaceae bacterium]|jgi:alanine racemase|nr:alanine racemase [Rickettsiaceae bacterium]
MSYSQGILEINLDNIIANYNYLSLIANTEIAYIKSKSFSRNLLQPSINYSVMPSEGGDELYLTSFKKQKKDQVETAAVIKADAYGLGAKEVAQKLFKHGCRKFFVAHLDEGIKLRKYLPIEASIFVLHGIFNGEASAFVDYDLVPVINHLGQIKIWDQYAKKLGRTLDCILNFNTGMNRLEIPEGEIPEILYIMKQNKLLNPLYVMSHLACADEINNEFNDIQLKKFNKIRQLLPKVKASFANSSGIFLGPEYHFDLLRPGMALYGLNPCPEAIGYIDPMRPAISLKTKIIQVNTISRNDTVGYGCSERIKAGTVIATIPIGYADGYNRQLSNKGFVYVAGVKAKIVGRVSMDLVTLDITSVPQEFHKLGQEVEIFGKNLTPDTLATKAAGFNYEFLTSLGKRYIRSYIGAVE